MAMQNPKRPLKAALYVRVSTDFQKDKDSIPMQIKDLKNFAKLLGIEKTELFKDPGYSAKNTNRPDFLRMMERCRKGEFTHVLIWKLDRISRNLVDFVNIYTELEEYQVALVSKTEQFDTSSEMGMAIMKIIMIFAELERKMTVMRVKAVMNNRAEEGIWNGGPPPWGYMHQYDSEGKVIPGVFPIPDPNEAPIIVTIFETYKKTKSLQKTAQALMMMGILSREGVPLNTPHVARVLNKKFYYGTYEYNKRNGYKSGNSGTKPREEWIECENTHPGIITKELWEECQRIKSGNRSFNRKTGQLSELQQRHIFAGYSYCSHCGHAMDASILPSRRNPKAPFLASRYTCHIKYDTIKGCESKGSISELKLLPYMLKFISRLLEAYNSPELYANDDELCAFLLKDIFDGATGIEESRELFRIFRSRVKEHNIDVSSNRPYVSNTVLIAEAKEAINKQQKAYDRLHKLYLFDDTSMTEEEFMARKTAIDERIKELNHQIEALSSEGEEPEEEFLADAGKLILLNKIKSSNNDFEYYSTVKLVPKKVLREFMMIILHRLEFKSGKVSKIVFKNGLKCTLKY